MPVGEAKVLQSVQRKCCTVLSRSGRAVRTASDDARALDSTRHSGEHRAGGDYRQVQEIEACEPRPLHTDSAG